MTHTWLAAGKSATLVREAMGHSDLKTTMGYTHLAKADLRSLVASPAAQSPENRPQSVPRNTSGVA
jgi:site-specific recombinase XerD